MASGASSCWHRGDNSLKDELERRVGLPVRLENDANGATWGEFRFGAARDVDDAVMLTVGTVFAGLGLLMGSQLTSLSAELPTYQSTIRA